MWTGRVRSVTEQKGSPGAVLFQLLGCARRTHQGYPSNGQDHFTGRFCRALCAGSPHFAVETKQEVISGD